MQTVRSNLKNMSDWVREILYPLALFLSIGSLWGYAWAQQRVEQKAFEYYPALVGAADANRGQPADEAPQPRVQAAGTPSPVVATIREPGE